MLSLAVALIGASGGAQPPPRAKKLSLLPRPVATVRPGSPAALAYMSGQQSLLGWHAASTKPVATDPSGRPVLCLTTLNRNETIELAATTDTGGFAATDLDRVAQALRAAGGEEHPIDPRTLGLVYRIQRHFSVPEIRVVSGYRVPKPRSHSNHGKGRAIDMVVPGVPDEEVARFAREQGFTGVGVYPTSQF
ncbi:MAG: YcbK family protein, partial [Polyangiaceae bacterium]